MDDSRFTRLEVRVDEIKDDVSEIKAGSKVNSQMIQDLREDIKSHNELIKDHVAGDGKIITEIQPLLGALPHLAEMIDDHRFSKESKKRRAESLKYWSTRLGLASLVLGFIASLGKFLGAF